jgi:uncharacterized protein (DUF1810 family)
MKSNPLDRFIKAQAHDYHQALAEIKVGLKRSHWIWYIFPRLIGEGYSSTSQFYALRDVAEAKAYLDHPVLGARLVECMEAVMAHLGRTHPIDIFGWLDFGKVVQTALLFASLSPDGSIFHRVITRMAHC